MFVHNIYLVKQNINTNQYLTYFFNLAKYMGKIIYETAIFLISHVLQAGKIILIVIN